MTNTHMFLIVLCTLLSPCNCNRDLSELTTAKRTNFRHNEQNRMGRTNHRNLQSVISTLDGTCASSSLDSGDQLSTGSILCHPIRKSGSTPIHKFGIDSNKRLSYFVYDVPIWHAEITDNSDACVSTGACDIDQSWEFFRLQSRGSLVGYDKSRIKIWDSHENIDANGLYDVGDESNVNVIGDEVVGSTLNITKEGVFIQSGEKVTWRILSPNWDKPSASPVVPVATSNPTSSPSTSRPTEQPTLLTPQPTVMDDFVSVSGMVFLDSDGDGISDDNNATNSSLVSNIVVDLYDCQSDDATWLLVTRSNSSGHFIFDTDDSTVTSNDLSALLDEMNTTQFRAVFSSLPSGYVFSSASSYNNVDEVGQSDCWDTAKDGPGSIKWNAGIMPSSSLTKNSSSSSSEPSLKPSSIGTASSSTSSSSTSPSMVPTTSVGFIGGYGFFDADNNGIQYPDTEVEPRVADIDVRLYSCGKSGSNLDDDVLLAVTRTNDQGLYSFRNLTSAHYRVNVLIPSGYSLSSVWSGNKNSTGGLTDPDVDSAVDPDTGNTPCFPFVRGSTDLSRSFGLKKNASSSPLQSPSSSPVTYEVNFNSIIDISGFVFQDEDKNGYFAEGEDKAISNVDVALYDCNSTVNSLKLVSSTDENGMYGFDELNAGSYSVKFSPPIGFEFSTLWSGSKNENGELTLSDADSNVNPETGMTPCKKFNDSVYNLDVGMIISNDGAPSLKPTSDPKGDGTACSGGKCYDGMCRNVAGVCGSGLSFCNAQSVWTPDCINEEEEVPSPFPVTLSPSVPRFPTLSYGPSTNPSVHSISICNSDGTYGTTTFNENESETVMGVEATYTYSIEDKSGASMDDAVAQFEAELISRLACDYFVDSCLNCARRRLIRDQRIAIADSSVVGLSAGPDDKPNKSGSCTNLSSNCQVMNGILTSFFPSDTPVKVVDLEINQMLEMIQEEMATNDWNGIIVSYKNDSVSSIEAPSDQDYDDGGFPIGAIIGIAVAGLVALAAVTSIFVFFIRDRREKERQRMQLRNIPFGDGQRSLEDDESDSSESESSVDDMSGRLSAPSLVSGDDSFPTTMAHAREDVDDDDDDDDDETSSSSGSEGDEESYDDDEEEQDEEYNNSGANNSLQHDSLTNLKSSVSSDEAPPIYEQDDMHGNVEQSSRVRYSEEMRVEMDDVDMRHYDGSMQQEDDESINSADPPGRSFRDLHQGDEWSNIRPTPHSMSPSFVEGSAHMGDYQQYENEESSTPGSYNSNTSHRSNRSGRSNRSKEGNGDNTSRHSYYNEEGFIGEINQDSTGSKKRISDHEQIESYDTRAGYFDQHAAMNPGSYDYYSGDYIGPPSADQNSFYAYMQPTMTQSHQKNESNQYYDDAGSFSNNTSYSDSTQQVSNKPQIEQFSEEVATEQNYDEDEESISNIFKSLSEIQTRLATKGKNSSMGSSFRLPSSSNNITNQPHEQNGWEREGVVEDVSMDGSQMSSFDTRAAKNKWSQSVARMEAVNET